MAEIVFLSERDVAGLLDAEALRDQLASAMRALSEDRTSVPPRTATDTGRGLVLAMPGFVDGSPAAVKLVTLFAGNDALGLPTHQGLLVVFDADTGTPLAVLGAEHLTKARTAACAALAADTLARADAEVLAIIGAGTQADGHLTALAPIRRWTSVRVWNRTHARAADLARRHEGCRACATAEEAVRGADVVALCTHASEPLIDDSWVGPGTHVSSVGIGRELPDALVRRARVVVEWLGVADLEPPAGAAELGGGGVIDLVELGAVLSGNQPGRSSDEQITVYKSVGHAAEDVAAAAVVLAAARRHGAGTRLEL